MPSILDRAARKQVLLTRIAFERTQVREDVAQLRDSATFGNLMRGLFGGGRLARSLFGRPASRRGRRLGNSGSNRGWLPNAIKLFSRYRTAAAVVTTLMPLLGSLAGWKRIFKYGGLAAAGYTGWKALQNRGDEAAARDRMSAD